jgi:universal stress protein A
MLAPTRIMVPTDFSEYSDRAVAQGVDIARQYNAKLFLVHVVHEDVHRGNFDFTFPEEFVREVKDSAVSSASTSIQKELDFFPRSKEVEVSTNVRHGIPYDEILKEEKEKNIDLVVIASLGRSGLAKYLIGSVARNVLHGSTCPVLLTR